MFIKTQDGKRIVDTNDIALSGICIYAMDKRDFNGDLMLRLGKYENEEQLQEVFEKIENRIKEQCANDNFNMLFQEQAPEFNSIEELLGKDGQAVVKFIEKSKSRAIFEMPKAELKTKYTSPSESWYADRRDVAD